MADKKMLIVADAGFADFEEPTSLINCLKRFELLCSHIIDSGGQLLLAHLMGQYFCWLASVNVVCRHL